MNSDQLINKNIHILQRNKIIKDLEKFIFNDISNRILSSLHGINLSLTNCLEIGISNLTTYTNIYNQFKEIEYTAIDISKKILETLPTKIEKIYMDHDSWNFTKKFDLILSGYYIHLTNNFDDLLRNINNSLKDEGFFISIIPSPNSFHELKSCMIEADISMYGGAYKRFNESFSVNYINTLLKKNNFKKIVIEVDTITLQYEKFYSLLKDIRFLGNSNIYYDRKKNFEKKNYFNKVEDIYWKKYSNDKKLILQLEIICMSGWKK